MQRCTFPCLPIAGDGLTVQSGINVPSQCDMTASGAERNAPAALTGTDACKAFENRISSEA
jgi:hypothetical protein